MASSISPSPAFHSPSSSSSSTRSDTYPHNSRFSFPGPTKFIPPPPPRFTRPSSSSSSLTCRCLNNNNNNDGSTSDVPSPSDKDSRRWIQDGLRNAIQWFDGVVSAYTNNSSSSVNLSDDVEVEASGRESMVNNTDGKDGEWDWERWKQHFTEVDDQQRIVSILKSQLTSAIFEEDYEDAARLKVAIAAAATNDTVGSVMSHLNKAIEDERYLDAAFIRDYAGAGLVGWWAGLSDDRNDPYGRIIRISAEHGKYVAKSFSPRQLAMAREGTPLFEIFLTRNKKGEYKQQAVYLKQIEVPQDSPKTPSKSSVLTNNLDPLDPLSNKGDLIAKTVEETEDDEDSDDDSDITEESVFENIPQDMIPGVKDLKVKVFNIPIPGKIDRDMISRVMEQIMDGEDERDLELNLELEGKDAEDDLEGENDNEKNDIEGSVHAIDEKEAKNQIAIQIEVRGLDRVFRGALLKDILRVPARLERKSRLSFSFSVKQDDRQASRRDAQSLLKKKAKLRGNRSIDKVILDLEESISKGEINMKMLKDFGQLLNLTASQVQRPQPFSGSTTFNRIDFPTSPDPLNALYVGVHGLHSSEVIHLRRKFGQWQEDGSKNEFPNIEFYEYVEALKLTGDPDVPAGQVAFRAKIGKRYQLPHKGIIPEEFGVVARYRGQGRLAEPGFKNPRWVDGELVILDGKYIKGGPVVGFVYWAPEYHFLVFFNQLRLQN